MIKFPKTPKVDLDWERRLLRNNNKDQTIKACSLNVRLILENHPLWSGKLGYCEFSYKVWKKSAPPLRVAETGEWQDVDDAQVRHWIAEHYGFEPKASDVLDALIAVAKAAPFHPVREYLEGLEWDGRNRVDTWLMDYLGAKIAGDTDKDRRIKRSYLRTVGKLWLISAVARVMQPPVKADYVLILEGEQETGKSTSIQTLCGEEWFTDSPFELGQKDGFEHLRGKWIVELAELDSLNKAESTRAKQFFSSRTDRYRPSYARRAADFARQCIFCGTTNQHVYLRDNTGNRRYWPVDCARVDLAALARDRDQIWAEAVRNWMAGEHWWPDGELRAIFLDEQADRYDDDAWEAPVLDWLDGMEDSQEAQNGFDVSYIMEQALGMKKESIRRPEQTRVGQIMARSSWSRDRRYKSGRQVRLWVPPARAPREHEQRKAKREPYDEEF